MHSPFRFSTSPKRRPTRRYRRHHRRVRGGEQAAAIRGLTGAQLHLGVAIQPPTLAEAATMCGSSVGYIEAAKVVLASEDAELLRRVRRGDISLVAAAEQVKGIAKLLSALRAASPRDRAAAAKAVGADTIFDEMVVPTL